MDDETRPIDRSAASEQGWGSPQPAATKRALRYQAITTKKTHISHATGPAGLYAHGLEAF